MKLQTIALSLLMLTGPLSSADENSALKYPFYQEQVASMQNSVSNEMMVSNSGIASLLLRLDMIKRAKKSIEVEYFIYNQDRAGRVLTQALVEAAKRGVKVRMLVDKSLPVFALDAHIAKELREVGVDLRFYNDASALQLSTAQFRSHRKLFVIDDIEAITGGRNIGDDYFDLSEHFNFLDRDLYVKGTIVKAMRESFDEYFKHKVTENPKTPEIPRKMSAGFRPERRRALKRQFEQRMKNFISAQKNAKAFLTQTQADRDLLEKVEEIARPILDSKKMYNCPQTTYAADVPGARFSKRIESDFTDKFRVLRKVFAQKIENVTSEIIVSSPYFIHNGHTKSLMNTLIDKNVDIEIYTNSLGSTDAIYVAANFYKDVFKWQEKGVVPYIHNGTWFPKHPTISEGVKKAKWGTHSKTQIYDNNEVMIGTYNVDNRSNFYNSEMALFCKGNPELTAEVRESIHERSRAGYKIIGDHESVDSKDIRTDVYGNPTGMSKFIMNAIAIPSILLKDLL
ncbi:phospholipase D family protein [Halobacteriovorax sp. HLS]|uniref:phospholipase D family protein n=1 Tax=Halobacteriovorax sp. HLS TaxID=2234000 RepID=UPI000FD74B33|nr:phospholipase D family protein [Halobacteriovorax sp. HLS]